MGKKRGAGLATVLLVMAVLGTIALTLATTTTFHLRLSNRQSLGAQARNLSESVLAFAVDRLADQRSFGAGTTSTAENITVQFSADAPTGRLTFHGPQATSWGMPVSVNNLEGDTAVVLADGRSLPPFSAYLVAQAEYGGVTKLMESVITIPKYKYALATSGKVVSNGRLLVASIEDGTDLSGGLSAVPASDLKPGHLAALSTDQTVLDAASPSNATTITGDVVSGGSVTLGTYTNVQGSVLQNHEPEELPDIEVTDYDPAGWTGLETISTSSLTASSPANPVEMAGVWRRQGDLDVYGELDLDGGYLYVDGDLSITGGVSGKGSIFCTGDVNIGDASGFVSDNVQALVAEGDITISGGSSSSDRDNSFFTGVLFSKGGMNLSNVTVVGSVVNNSSAPNSTLTLNNVGLLSNPEKVSFDFGIPVPAQREHFDFDGGDNQLEFIPDTADFLAQYDASNDEFVTAGQGSLMIRIFETGDVGSHHDEPIPFGAYSSVQALHAAITDPNTPYHWSYNGQDSQALDQNVSDYYSWFNGVIGNVDDLYQNTKQESMQRGEFTLEPNQFIPFEDRVRVIWSRELPDL